MMTGYHPWDNSTPHFHFARRSGVPFDRYDRYLAIVAWARKRYTRDGWLTTHEGGRPSVFTRIENAAARRYLGIA